jgi:hypothetical protein
MVMETQILVQHSTEYQKRVLRNKIREKDIEMKKLLSQLHYLSEEKIKLQAELRNLDQ